MRSETKALAKLIYRSRWIILISLFVLAGILVGNRSQQEIIVSPTPVLAHAEPQVISAYIKDATGRLAQLGKEVVSVVYVGTYSRGLSSWYFYVAEIRDSEGSHFYTLAFTLENGQIVQVE